MRSSLLSLARFGSRQGERNALGNLGSAYYSLGELRYAIECHKQQLDIARKIGDYRCECQALGGLGNANAELGEMSRAIEYFEQAHAIARKIGDGRTEALSSWYLGLAYGSQGDLHHAVELMSVCVTYEQQFGHPDAAEHAGYVASLRAPLAAGQ